MNYYFLFPIYLINFYAKIIVNYQLVHYPLYREAPSTTGKSRRPTHSGVFFLCINKNPLIHTFENATYCTQNTQWCNKKEKEKKKRIFRVFLNLI